ncbi:hypothetical protein P167DRAFT_550042 [Morchella conica CCBAS932]|uniref:Uncharacterized protein n=1 Tax=Morchella conica CCBAS932 TaxID=1392247 RepID=A0A3N4K998_9PEZI|nr:hypothetical protein P167DRAFT_550042 [Morchella conica CCBAS932]
MPLVYKARVRSPESDDEGAALVFTENRHVRPYFAAARAEARNIETEQSEGDSAPGHVIQTTQGRGSRGEDISSESSHSDSSSEDEGEQDETHQVYVGSTSETLMGRILRWETDTRELQGAERLITPFPEEGEQLRMPPINRGLSDAHIAIYGSRPPTPHPFFEDQSYPTHSSSSTAPRTAELQATPPAAQLQAAPGNAPPSLPSQHSTCPHGAHCTGSPTPSSAPSESDPDPACGVCYRSTCTRRTYFASQKHFNHWPLGIDCPFCRRDVQFVKSDNDSGRIRRLPLWVVRWSIKGRTKVMKAHRRTVEPEEMRGYVRFMQDAIAERRYPTLPNTEAANTVVVGAPAPPPRSGQKRNYV